MDFKDEINMAEIICRLEGSLGGINTAFLYNTEPLQSSEYDQRTLRVNADLMGFDDTGEYSGSLYTVKEIDENISISLEPQEEFPQSISAQAILTEEPVETESGQPINYTVGYAPGLENFSRENEVRNTYRRGS